MTVAFPLLSTSVAEKAMHKLLARLGLATVAGAPLVASAAVDVSEITGSLTDIAAVGAAVFAVAVGIKLYKWVRRAL